MMKVIYIAGPYLTQREGYDRHHGIQRNIVEASQIAAECWRRGWAVICPHMNTGGFHNLGISESVFIHGCLELVRRCDAILMMDGWERSDGAKREYGVAKASGIRIFYYNRDKIPEP